MTWWCFSSGLSFRIGLAAVALPTCLPAANLPAPAPVLSLPLACDFERDCSIQKYVDRDASSGRQDYRCGRITTDGHDGTDLRLRREEDLARDIPVLAAADGTVLRVRDGMADRNVRELPAGSLGDRLAGNAVIVDHGEGWVTQYSHLKMASIVARPGTRVRRGDRLGFVGMSGNAEFPHLHFKVRKDGKTIDPFLAIAGAPCGGLTATLWDKPAATRLAYQVADVLRAGFATSAQDVPQRRHAGSPAKLPEDAAALIIWATATGVQPGDVQAFRILGPDERIIFDKAVTVLDGGLDWLAFAGVAGDGRRWAPGRYTGSYALKRSNNILSTRTITVMIK